MTSHQTDKTSTTFTVRHHRTRGYLVQINDFEAGRVERRMAQAIVMLSTGGDRVAASEILEDIRNGGAATGVSAVTFTWPERTEYDERAELEADLDRAERLANGASS